MTDEIEPIFDPTAWALTDKQAKLSTLARELASSKFAPRAEKYDREATFPTENYKDLATSGLLGICIPEDEGGLGADLKTYMLTAAEIGRFCGATALTFNMHVSSCLWTGDLLDQLELDADIQKQHKAARRLHYRRILDEGKIYAQPFSEGGAAAAGFKAFGTTALKVDGGWRVNGKKIFASLSGHANFYGALCTALTSPDEEHSRRNTMYLAVPADADGVRVEGDWRWPHMFMTLTPAYMGIAQACYDFTVAYLRGEVPGTPPVKRRMYPTKQLAVAQMRVMLEQTKGL